ncbi:hypothetical protein KL864_33240 [Mycolicibacterium goodii]|uniref:hypothetical protein n=1 Tax=Mycolicibacterium goodii TaxID=134601 RepID=UPI001BDC6017|nr:hypothetical protein [Mycolicibacterium goodii]MBU8820736.1 hypothetical protein [Mycolicibacterium goodii]
MLVAGLLGGVVGGIVGRHSAPQAPPPAATSATPTYSAETIRAQNIQLCTAYATINSAMPSPAENAMQVLPGTNGLRLALQEAPAASPEIRSALEDVVHQFDAMIAAFGKVRTRGLAEPPRYDVERAQKVSDRAWDVCRLG